ncbi:cupredoxin domain-containing protein [Nonomuraea sp. NPDC004354]
MRAINKFPLAGAGAAVVLLAVTGFAGAGGLQAASAGPGPATATASPSAAAKNSLVEVTMKEFSFAFARNALPAGTYTFVLDNVGKTSHAMAITGPGMKKGQQSKTVEPGQKGRFTVTLQRGRYAVWCPIGNHRAQGMQTTLTVT